MLRSGVWFPGQFGDIILIFTIQVLREHIENGSYLREK